MRRAIASASETLSENTTEDHRVTIIAELHGPKGRQAQPDAHIAKKRKPMRLSWLAALLVGVYARRRRSRGRSRATWQPYFK